MSKPKIYYNRFKKKKKEILNSMLPMMIYSSKADIVTDIVTSII